MQGIRPKVIGSLLEKTQWVDTGGLIVPSGYVKPNPKKIERRVGIYYSFKDIFNEDNNEKILFDELSQYDKVDILQALAKVNYFLSENYNRPSEKFEIDLVRDLFDVDTKKEIVKHFGERQKMFTHQQLLALIKICLVTSQVGNKKVMDDRIAFGKTLARVTDFLEADTVKASDSVDEKDPLWRKIMAVHLSRNISFNSYTSHPDNLVIFWLLYFQYLDEIKSVYPREYYDLKAKFAEITGIDIELYFSLLIVIWLHYFQMLKNNQLNEPDKFLLGRSFFAKMLPQTRKDVVKLFDAVSGSVPSYKEDLDKQTGKLNNFYFTFSAIWKKPFLKIEEGTYFPLDMTYIEERVTVGLYWTITDYLMESGLEGEKDKFQGYYGRVFEALAYASLERNFGSQKGRLFLEKNSDTGGVDAIVYYPGALFFIEFTTSSIRRDFIMSANVEGFISEIKRIFTGKEGRSSKGRVVKIHGSINKFKEGTLLLEGVDRDSIHSIYPVILFQNAPPQLGGIWDLYFEIIQQAKDEKGNQLLSDCWRNFQVLDIEEFFVLEQLIRDGNDMPALFNTKIKSQYVNDSWKNYLIFNNLWKRNDYLGAKFEELIDMAAEKLFGRKLSEWRRERDKK